MELQNILAGTIQLPVLSLNRTLDIRIPNIQDIKAIIPKLSQFKTDNHYTEIDAETELLAIYPDYYTVVEQADKKRDEILLSLSPDETPDERFYRDDNTIDYEKYIKQMQEQMAPLVAKMSADPLIKKSLIYKDKHDSLYKLTIEYEKKMYGYQLLLEQCSNITYDELIALPIYEYSAIMESWGKLLEGMSLPF